MSIFPGFPELPALSDEVGQAPASRQNPLGIALPLLLAGGLGAGGGQTGLLEGIARGWQIGQQMRERREALTERRTLLEEQRAERQAALRRGFLERTSLALAGIDDPDEFEQVRNQLRGVATEFGVRPEEIDVYAFPAAKRSRLKRSRANEVLNRLIQVHGAPKVFGELLDTTVEVDGEALNVRQLLKLAEFPVPTREVKRPVIEERPAPEVTGTGPGLVEAGLPQRIQVGEETVREEVLPEVKKRVTLAEYDPRFRTTPFARTPVPLDKDGEIDSAAIMRFYGEARNQGIPGFADPIGMAKARYDRVVNERNDVLKRIDALQTNMDKTEVQSVFVGNFQALQHLVADVIKHKSYLGLEGQLRPLLILDEKQAIAQWVAEQQARRRKAAGAGEFAVEPGQPGQRYRVVRGPRGGQAFLDTQTNLRLSYAEVEQRARIGDQDAARLLKLPTERIPEAIPGTLPENLAEAQALKTRLRLKLQEATTPQEARAVARRLEAVDARIMAIKRKQRRGSGINTSALPPAPPSRAAAAAPQPKPSQAPKPTDFPDARRFAGRTITDSVTGKRYRSDGTRWVEIQ